MIDRALYVDYLQSKEWARRRDKVMMRCNGVCEGCHESLASEVHHLTYEHITQEFLFELVGLCADCHARYHDKPARPKPTWTRLASVETPGSIVRRARLAELAIKARAKLMNHPIEGPLDANEEDTRKHDL